MYDGGLPVLKWRCLFQTLLQEKRRVKDEKSRPRQVTPWTCSICPSLFAVFKLVSWVARRPPPRGLQLNVDPPPARRLHDGAFGIVIVFLQGRGEEGGREGGGREGVVGGVVVQGGGEAPPPSRHGLPSTPAQLVPTSLKPTEERWAAGSNKTRAKENIACNDPPYSRSFSFCNQEPGKGSQ